MAYSKEIEQLCRVAKNSRFDNPDMQARQKMESLLANWDDISDLVWKMDHYRFTVPSGERYFMAYDTTEKMVYTAVLSLRNSWSVS